MAKKTKIIATIGPSSQSKKVLKEMFANGVDLARLNTKHNSLDWHRRAAQKIRKAAQEEKRQVGIIVDIQGPEIRTTPFEKESITIQEGDKLFFSYEHGEEVDIVIEDKKVISSFKKGQRFSIDDGFFKFKVTKIKKNGFWAESLSSGELKGGKSINIPFLDVPLPSLRERDIRFIKGLGRETDYVALSFVRYKQDVLNLRKELKAVNPAIGIISKIEKPEAIENIDEIIEVSDALMVARGDLAIEAGFEKIPALQKEIILKTRRAGKPVIVATQMLESMIENHNPTRAEVSDVANAVFEAVDCVMLSAETAVGKNPVRTVEVMTRVIEEAEKKNLSLPPLFPKRKLELDEKSIVKLGAILPSLVREQDLPKGFIVFTVSGSTAFSLASFRPGPPIFAFSENKTVMDKLLLSYNTTPFYIDFGQQKRAEEMIKEALNKLKRANKVETGDKLVVVSGDNIGVRGSTNNIRISIVD